MAKGLGLTLQHCQKRLASGDQLLGPVLDREQLAGGKHLLLAWFDDTGSGNEALLGRWAQAVDREVGSKQRGPTRVAAAKPQAVSISALTTPAWRKPEYCPTSVRQGIANSTAPGAQVTTSKPHQRLNSAESLIFRTSAVGSWFIAQLHANVKYGS